MRAGVSDLIADASRHTFLILGLGSIGQRHARNLRQLGARRILAVRTGLGMRPVPDELGIEAYADLNSALAQKPDVALVCNPTNLHRQSAQQLIDAGLDVLVEKPISNTLAGVEELVASAARHKRILGVAYPLRNYPYVRKVRDWLGEGRLGAVRYARAAVGQYPPAWTPQYDYRQSYAVRRELGGGAVLTFIHEIDMLLYLLGMPDAVTARTRHVSNIETDADDLAEIILEYPSGVGSVHIDYVQKSPIRSRYLQLVGEDAALWLDFAAHTLELYDARGALETLKLENFDGNQLHVDVLCAFLQAVDTRVPPEADGESGVRALKVALAAFDSSTRGALTHIP